MKWNDWAAGAVAVLVASSLQAAGPMKPQDRQQLMAHLEMTSQWLTDEVKGLSAAQWNYKMTPDSWSIANVVDHLSVAEPQYWEQLQQSMQKAPYSGELKASDLQVMWYGIDRTRRARTAEAREPKGRYASPAETLAAVGKLRAAMLDYARTTDADLRAYQFLDGQMSAYQWFLMISTHMQRHILQIREIKSHAGYPQQ